MARKKYSDGMYDFATWFEVIKDLIFRIRVYRRMGDWTPYEMEHPDEIPSQYQDGDAFVFCKIEKAIELSDGDVLLGVRYIDNETKEPLNFVEYHNLSNINLIQVDEDNKEVKAEDEYDDD